MNNSIDWSNIEKRYNELEAQIGSSSLESSKRHLVQKEFSYLSTLLTKHKEIERLKAELVDIVKQLNEVEDPEFLTLYNEEKQLLELAIEKELTSLDKIMFPPDELDNRSVFLEIRAGAGGAEASLFAADLMRMYTMYATKHNWQVAVISTSMTDLGGYREIILHIEGKEVFGHFKFESGVHRVQRVPATETAGRIHTSTVTVAVLPEAKEVDVTINPADLRIDVFRAGGAGGQHVNVTDSAVRITHIPTGVVVSCQDERSQHKNKAKALKVLQSRILAAQKEKHEMEVSQQRKEQVGTGMRAEKVRTYNFPQNRVTDHQIDMTLNKLDMVMLGEIDEIIDALRESEYQKRRQKPFAIPS